MLKMDISKKTARGIVHVAWVGILVTLVSATLGIVFSKLYRAHPYTCRGLAQVHNATFQLIHYTVDDCAFEDVLIFHNGSDVDMFEKDMRRMDSFFSGIDCTNENITTTCYTHSAKIVNAHLASCTTSAKGYTASTDTDADALFFAYFTFDPRDVEKLLSTIFLYVIIPVLVATCALTKFAIYYGVRYEDPRQQYMDDGEISLLR